MDEIVYYNDLYDLYGSLLTIKQKSYFEDYYFHNLSYAEIAENYNVSRNACFRQIHMVTKKLEEYEEKLKLLEKKKKIIELSEKIQDKKIQEELSSIF
ncbi:MAG: hypothetical protein IKE70_02835 [Bacilli bacterium]|nr:hypothetical protein [Bacilli bacterium]